MFASQTRAQTVNVQLALGNTCKGDSSISEYIGKMKSLGDQMEAAGRPLEDEELIQYILTGLDEEHTSLVSALCARVEPLSISELFSQLLNFETYINLFSNIINAQPNLLAEGVEEHVVEVKFVAEVVMVHPQDVMALGVAVAVMAVTMIR
jgi:hypothetical protein